MLRNCFRMLIVGCAFNPFIAVSANADEPAPQVEPATIANKTEASLPPSAMSLPQLQEDFSSLKTRFDASETRLKESERKLDEAQIQNQSLWTASIDASQRVNSRVSAADFFPGAVNTNLMGENDIAPTQTRFGAGSRLGDSGFIFRTVFQGSVSGTYDTGFVGGKPLEMDPGTIALRGSAARHQSGFFQMTDAKGNLAVDLQKQFTETGDDVQAQAYLETQIDNSGQLVVRHAFGRTDLSNIAILAGQFWTAWGDEGTLPHSLTLNSTAAGTVYSIVPQLRLATSLSDEVLASVAIQNPLSSTIDSTDPTDPAPPAPPTPNAVLQRYPDLAMRIRYLDSETRYNSCSVGALIRGLGIETNLGQEQVRTGWGITANCRTLIAPCSAIQYGAVGGRGLGGDIFGLQTVAGVASDPSNLLQNQTDYGGYLGFTQLFSDHLQFNTAYGIARGDSTPAVPFHKAQNAWANLIYRNSDQLSVGFEYHWGENEIGGIPGDNHRVLLTVQITPKAKSTDNSTPAATPFGGTKMFAPGMPAPATFLPQSNGGDVSRFKRL